MKIFDGFSNLKFINLGDNLLTKVRVDWIASGNKIEQFHLTNNALAKPIDRSFIWRLQNAKIINLDGTGCTVSLDKFANPKQKFMEFYTTLVKSC